MVECPADWFKKYVNCDCVLFGSCHAFEGASAMSRRCFSVASELFWSSFPSWTKFLPGQLSPVLAYLPFGQSSSCLVQLATVGTGLLTGSACLRGRRPPGLAYQLFGPFSGRLGVWASGLLDVWAFGHVSEYL